MTKDKITADAVAIAQFKFALIAPVLQGLFPDPSRTAYYKRVTKKPLTLPDGTVKNYGYKTLEKWVSQYNLEGFDALMPASRSDKGTSRALSDTAIEEIYRLKEAFPRLMQHRSTNSWWKILLFLQRLPWMPSSGSSKRMT